MTREADKDRYHIFGYASVGAYPIFVSALMFAKPPAKRATVAARVPRERSEWGAEQAPQEPTERTNKKSARKGNLNPFARVNLC